VKDILLAIVYNEGKRTKDYIKDTGIPKSSAERYLKIFRKAELVEYIGDTLQTGGYFLTKSFKKKLKN
jgi:hypothetical protein